MPRSNGLRPTTGASLNSRPLHTSALRPHWNPAPCTRVHWGLIGILPPVHECTEASLESCPLYTSALRPH